MRRPLYVRSEADPTKDECQACGRLLTRAGTMKRLHAQAHARHHEAVVEQPHPHHYGEWYFYLPEPAATPAPAPLDYIAIGKAIDADTAVFTRNPEAR